MCSKTDYSPSLVHPHVSICHSLIWRHIRAEWCFESFSSWTAEGGGVHILSTSVIRIYHNGEDDTSNFIASFHRYHWKDILQDIVQITLKFTREVTGQCLGLHYCLLYEYPGNTRLWPNAGSMLAYRLRLWHNIGSMSRLHYCHCMNPQQTRYADTMLDRCGRLWITIEPPVVPAVWCTGGMAVMWFLSLQLVLLSGVLAAWPSCDCWASSWSCCLVYWRHGRDVIVEPPVGPAVWCTGGMTVMWLLSLQLVLLSGVLAVWPSCDCWASSCSCCLVYWRHGRDVIVEPPVGPAVWCIGGMAVMWFLSLQLVLLSGVLAAWPSCDCWASSWSCCLVYWRYGRHVIVEPPVVPAVWCTGGMAVMWLLSLQLVLLSGVLTAWPWWDCCIKWKWVSEGIVLKPFNHRYRLYSCFFYSFKFLLTYCISALKQVKDIKWHKSAVI